MAASVSDLPNWLRWVLLLPASLAGGFIAGYLIYLLNASYAEHPRAPIVFIAEYLGGLASNLVAFHIAYVFAPSYERRVLLAFIIVGVAAGLLTTYVVVDAEDYEGLCLVAGNLTACYVAWRKYVKNVAPLDDM